MRAYMVSDSEPCEGAVLVFATTAREAKKVGFSALDWCDEWVDVRVQWLKDDGHLRHLWDGETEHVVESPPTCQTCQLWGTSELIDGVCEGCREYVELVPW